MSWRILHVLGAAGLFILAGCGGSGLKHKLVPVSGRVMLGNQPLTIGRVSFVPDSSKGNNAHVECVGRIGPTGRYEIYTKEAGGSESSKGVPLGAYKVILVKLLPEEGGSPELERRVNRSYFDATQTPLSIEVVENAPEGAYDLKVAK